jgi:hypothetical protein
VEAGVAPLSDKTLPALRGKVEIEHFIAPRMPVLAHDKVGHLETLPIDLLNAHLDASFIFDHLDTMNGGPNFSSVTAPRKKAGL